MKKDEIESSVDKVGSAVTALTATEVGIAELTTKYKDVVYDCADAKQMKAAKKARAEIREPRYNIETLRKAAKAPVLGLGRDIQTLAADLTARVLALETPIHEQIKVEEDRVEAAKQKIIDTENERILTQQRRIASIHDSTSDLIAKGFADSTAIIAAIDDMKAHPVDNSFEEFQDDAQSVWDASLEWLDNIYAKTVEAEEAAAAASEQARENAARQKELDEQQEKMEAQQRELDKQAEEQRKEVEAAKLAADAEQKRKDDERQAELDKQAEAQRKRDEELAAAQKKIDDENARIAKEAADRKARKEADERAETQRKSDAEAAAKKAVYPGDDAISGALMAHFGVPDEVARKWITHIKQNP